MSKDLAIIILAAGKGTRMGSPLPKVLTKVAGKSLIGYAIDSIIPLSPTKIITVIGQDMDNVIDEVNKITSTESVIQQEQLGTGHAVQQVIPALDSFAGNVLILYGDTPFVTTQIFEKMVAKLDDAAVVILGFVPEDPAQYGRLVADGDDLQAIVEFKEASDEQKKITLCNSGVVAARGDLLAELLDELSNDNAKGEYYLTDIVEIACNKGFKCSYIETQEKEVMGINSQKDRANAEAQVQEELRDALMEKGVCLIAPETVFLCDDTEIGEGSIVHPNVVFGAGVKIQKNVEILSFSHIEGAIVAENVRIGPFARIRPGSELAEDAKIGNFVEIKNSKVGTGTKINHLSYVGDASLGENTNIGAGCITCNYDGYNKHHTEIGDNVSLGSNSSLVAPITIGDGAIIGAGSTVIKDVDADSTVVNKMPQQNYPNRAKEYRKKKAAS